VGIYVHERLDGILLLAPRVSGRIYSANDQDALQISCNQFGTSVDNSRLYTTVQDQDLQRHPGRLTRQWRDRG
jgi:GAF domain-containing protein